MNLPKLLVVDDQEIILSGIVDWFTQTEKDAFQVLVSSDTQDGLEQYKRHRPDVVLMDLLFGHETAQGFNQAALKRSGLNAIQTLRNYDPNVKIVAYSQCDDRPTIEKAYQLGVYAYVGKNDLLKSLSIALKKALNGEYTVPPTAAEKIALSTLALDKQNIKRFNLRELNETLISVLRLYLLGYSTEQVAEQLGITVKAVSTRWNTIKNKTGLRSLAPLMVLAIEQGLISLQHYWDEVKE